MDQILIDGLCRVVGKENVKLEEPMEKHTTFQIGGPAQIFVVPTNKEQVRQVVLLCNRERVPFFVLGKGSNLLVSDAGIEGVVMQMYEAFSDYQVMGNRIYADSGIMLSKLGRIACEEGLAGFEFASGIPGTLGGAVMMNAGAYGGEMKDIIESVCLMDQEGNVFTKSCEEMEFSYRHSIVEENHYIVLGATICLERGERAAIQAKMAELMTARKTKQPLEFPSAGSTFKRPEGYFAGKLIMDAGLSGYQVGGAQVSEKHCGFVINRGNATAVDVTQLIADVRKKVYDAFQVELEPEVRLVGREI